MTDLERALLETPRVLPHDDRRFHLLVAENAALCTQAGDTTTVDIWGHYLTETPDNVDCPKCLAWMHA